MEQINHVVVERPDGFGALCRSLSLHDSLLKRKAATCKKCLGILARAKGGK